MFWKYRGLIIIILTRTPEKTVILFQRLSIALHQGHVISFLHTMNTEWEAIVSHFAEFHARSFVLVGKNSTSSYSSSSNSSNNSNNLVYFWDMGYMYAVDGSEVYLTAVVYSRKRVNTANILSHQVYLLSPLAVFTHPRLTVTCSNNAKYYCPVDVCYVICVVPCGVLYRLHFFSW